jgi:phthalate 4,5-dioxygenase
MAIVSDTSGATTAPAKPTVSGKQRYSYLAHTDRGTVAGDLLRRYWQPIALESELGKDPLPVRIFGEDLVLFVDDQGRAGALDRRCAHRCTDISLGRIEDGGIRCPYHGWLFGVDGQCLDQPAEPARPGPCKSSMRRQPCVDTTGLSRDSWRSWTPLFPDYPALRGSNDYRYVNIDPVHTSYLHKIELNTEAFVPLHPIAISAPLGDMKARWGVFANNAMPAIKH